MTVCTYRKWPILGGVINGEMVLNDWGKVVDECWHGISKHFKNVEMDAYIIMPNHVHGIILINSNVEVDYARPVHGIGHTWVPSSGRACSASTGNNKLGLLSVVLRSFKSAVTKRINVMRHTPSVEIWDRSFYDHIIRNDSDLIRIREYIINNPATWEFDENNSI